MNAMATQWSRDHNRRNWLVLFWMLVTMIAVPAVRADIYFWQDGQGVIHFSNQEAPPSSSLYMREPEPLAAGPTPAPDAGDASKIDDEMQAKLSRTHRKLEQALERVDELTEKVRDSQQAAAAATALARQAAQMSAVNAATSAAQTTDSDRQRRVPVVRYVVPYGNLTPPRYDPHRSKHHEWKPFPSRFKRAPQFNRHRPNPRKTIRIDYKARPKVHHRRHLTKANKGR